MKRISLFFTTLLAGLLGSQAVWAQTQAGASSSSVGATPLTDAQIAVNQDNYAAWDVPEQAIGPNHRTTFRNTKAGQHEIVEIGTGMNYWNGTQWSPSVPQFVATKDGFVANQVQHQVHLGGNLIANGAVTVQTPDGVVLNSTPLAIALYDSASGDFQVIATVTNCAPTQVSSNEVMYIDAFSGSVCASVVYTITAGKFHQDVMITGHLDPADYGFPTNTTQIQILTEFYNAPTPDVLERPIYVEQDPQVRAKMVAPDLVDEELGFGQFVMTTGKAYVAPNEVNTGGNEAPVTKAYKTIAGRTYLFESVPFVALAGDLLALPSCGTSGLGGFNSTGIHGYAGIPKPTTKPAKAPEVKLASYSKKPGVVIDYVATIGGTLTGTTVFKGDTTYLVSSAVTCNGATTIEGGAVFKYKSGTSITLNSTLTCKTGMYRPTIFTGVDDDTVGDTMNGVTGSGYTGTNSASGYANPALATSTALTFSGLRFRYAQEAIQVTDASSTSWTVLHSQFINCIRGIELVGAWSGCGCGCAASYLNLYNCLMSAVQYPLYNSTTSPGSGPPPPMELDQQAAVQTPSGLAMILGPVMHQHQYISMLNCTFDQVTQLDYNSGSNLMVNFNVTNSVFANLSALTNSPMSSSGIAFSGAYNGFYSATTFGSSPNTAGSLPFQTAGAGSHYLTSASGFRDYGGGVLPASLANDLKLRTTYPPTNITQNTTITTSVALVPQVQRDTDTPDLGYHYDPIDYAYANVYVTNAAVTMSNGVVVATFGTNNVSTTNSVYGLGFGSGSSLSSLGTPNLPNWFVLYNTVMENVGTNGNWQVPTNSVTGELYNRTPAPSIYARFTSWSVLAQDAPQFYAPTNTGPIAFQDSEFHGGKIITYRPTIDLTNCLLERVYASLATSDGNSPYIRNSLFYGGTFNFAPNVTNAFVKDNFFDQTIIPTNTSVYTIYNGGYNGFVTGNNRLLPTASSDVILTNSPAYQTGPLGSYYQLTTSLLINLGHATADQVGLYHYTVTTNLVSSLEIKETNSVVDIGYHYVAVDINGNPIDADSDGFPDYWEDVNGNGIHDEIPSNLPLTNLVLWLKADAITGLTNNSPVATWSDQSGHGNHATQYTGGNQPAYVTNALNGMPVIRFDGTNSYFNLPNMLGGSNAAEAFVVLKVATNRPAQTRMLWQFGSSYGSGSYPATDGSVAEEFGLSVAQGEGVPAQDLMQYHLYEVATQSNNFTAWINGVVQNSVNNPPVGFSKSPKLGYYYTNIVGTGFVTGHFGGDMAEVLVFDRGLTTAERETVGSYLNGKYALVPAVPAPPTNLVATAISATQIGLSWNETLNGGATRISIERKTGSNGVYAVVGEIPNALSYVDTNLMAGTNYYYRVRAANLTVWSGYSNETNAVTPVLGADAPLGDLLLWLKADSGLNQVGANARVNFWSDQSGHGNHATQYTGGNQPAYVTNALNGMPVIRFDGTNSYFNLPNMLGGSNAAEAFVVLKVATNRPAQTRMLWQFGSSYGSGSYPATDGSVAEEFGLSVAQGEGVPAQDLMQYHLYEVATQSNNFTAWINGVVQNSVNNPPVGFSKSPKLGYYYTNIVGTGFVTGHFGGDMAEVLVFDRGLTTAERETVGSYLNGKYALVPAVPAPPTNLVATAISATQIGLSWNETLNGGATRISIERKTGSNGVYAVVGEIPNALSYVDTNLMAGTNYYYRVRAANLTVWSGYSNETNAVTPVLGADAPLGDLLLWLKADSGLNQVGANARVNFWSDQSGHGNHATQYTGGNQPAYVTNALNGMPVIRFDGTNSYFNLPNMLGGSNAAEAFVVLKVATNRPAQTRMLWQFGSSYGSGSYPATDGSVAEEFGLSVAQGEGVPAQDLMQYHLYEVATQSNNFTAWINGVVQNSVNNPPVGFSKSPKLGYYYTNIVGTGFVTGHFGGDMAEVLVFDRGLTTAERETVGSYIASKYSLAGSALDGSAPTAPTNFIASGISSLQLNLQWTPATTNAASFRLERKLGTNGNYQEIADVPSIEGQNFIDTTANPTNQYCYRVLAQNYFGHSGYSVGISPPVASLTLFATNNFIITGTTNYLVAHAFDAFGTINQIQILRNYSTNVVIAAGVSSAYTNSWVPIFPDNYSLAALATDSLGNSRYSEPLNITTYLDSNGDGIPDVFQVQSGNDPLNPWIPPAFNPSDHTAPVITLLIPTNAVVVP